MRAPQASPNSPRRISCGIPPKTHHPPALHIGCRLPLACGTLEDARLAHQACLLLQWALTCQVLGLGVGGLLQAGHLLEDFVASLGDNKQVWDSEQIDNAVHLQDVSARLIKPKKQTAREQQPAQGA